MIPKVIHYCWFGGKKKPQDVLDCIASWKKYLPDYRIIEWNESNYDITKNQYMHDAYKEKKWAFVSDYCRIDVVYQEGGIYLDTDVEVVRSFNDLLTEKFFCGFESRDPIMDIKKIRYEESVAFGLGFGSIKGHKILKDLLDLYAKMNFYNPDSSLNLMACPHYQTEVLKNYGLVANRKTQRFEGGIAYSPEYFCPQSNLTDEMLCLTENTYSIHHFTGTWGERYSERRLAKALSKSLPQNVANALSTILYLPQRTMKKLKKIFKK